MLNQINNLRYSRHLMATNYVGLELFFHAINLNVVSSCNVFRTLVSLFRCNVLLFRINEISLFNIYIYIY